MALKHKWLEKAQADFYDTLEFVFSEFGENTAERVYAEVTDMVKLLCVFPLIINLFFIFQRQNRLVPRLRV